MKFMLNYMDIKPELLDAYNTKLIECPEDKFKSLFKDIIQILENFNISFSIYGINAMQSIAIKSMKDISVEVKEREGLDFYPIKTDNEGLQSKYCQLIDRTRSLVMALTVKGIVATQEEIDYLIPMSKLKDCNIQMNITQFLKFIQTCFEYKELGDIIESITECDEVERMLSLVQMSNMVDSEDIYLRRLLDDVTRGEVHDVSMTGTMLETDLTEIKESLDMGKMCHNDKMIPFMSYMTCSLRSYDEMLNYNISRNAKIENPMQVISSTDVNEYNIIIPENISNSELGEDVVAHVNYTVDLINEMAEGDTDIMLLQLAGFMTILKYNITVNKDIAIMKEILHDCKLVELNKLMMNRKEIMLKSSIMSFYFFEK